MIESRAPHTHRSHGIVRFRVPKKMSDQALGFSPGLRLCAEAAPSVATAHAGMDHARDHRWSIHVENGSPTDDLHVRSPQHAIFRGHDQYETDPGDLQYRKRCSSF